PLALVAEKKKVNKRKEKVVVSSDSKGSGADDFSELKKITALLAKAFNQRKFYSKPINNNLRTSSTSQSANKKQEFVKSDNKKVEKKDDEKKRDMSKVKYYNYYKTKMLLAKKDSDEQVLLAEDQAWMESSSDSYQEINANMIETKVLHLLKKPLLSVGISPISKIPFRKKPRDSMNVCFKSNLNKSLLRTVHRWLLKMQPLAETVAKWTPRIIQICLWIIDSGCSKHMTDGVDFLIGDRSSNLYTIALNEFASNSLTCLLAKASSSESWLWHQRLSHLNFATINNLVKNNLLQASEVIISFIKKTQVNLQLQVQRVRTDNGTEFKNKTLAKFFDEIGITQQFSAARTPQQNGVVERRNPTLVEAARTMLTFANLP
nr:putative copia-type Pol polyprotein [Tanacetum cinerariifolium]